MKLKKLLLLACLPALVACGGGEAPAIDIWNGVEGQVGDGNQGEWSGGLFARQKFDGVTGASDSEKFKDPETGENVFFIDFKGVG